MKIKPVQRAVEEFGITSIIVGDQPLITVGSKMYETIKEWFIKGEFRVEEDPTNMTKILYCERIEKDILVVRRPESAETLQDGAEPKKVVIETASPEEVIPEARIHDTVADIDYVYLVCLAHIENGKHSGSQMVRFRDIPRYIEAAIRKYKNEVDPNVTDSMFRLLRVDLERKQFFVDML